MFKCVKENILACIDIIKFLIDDYYKYKEQTKKRELETKKIDKEYKRLNAEEKKMSNAMQKWG